MSEPMPSDVARLIRALVDRSQRGELKWQPVEGHDTGFLHTGRAGSVSIVSRDGDGMHPFVFSILTPEGVVGDSWSSVHGGQRGYTDYAPTLEALYHIARRSAAGSTTLVNDLLKEIEPDDIPF